MKDSNREFGLSFLSRIMLAKCCFGGGCICLHLPSIPKIGGRYSARFPSHFFFFLSASHWWKSVWRTKRESDCYLFYEKFRFYFLFRHCAASLCSHSLLYPAPGIVYYSGRFKLADSDDYKRHFICFCIHSRTISGTGFNRFFFNRTYLDRLFLAGFHGLFFA